MRKVTYSCTLSNQKQDQTDTTNFYLTQTCLNRTISRIQIKDPFLIFVFASNEGVDKDFKTEVSETRQTFLNLSVWE